MVVLKTRGDRYVKVVAFSLPVGVLKSATDNGVLGLHAFLPARIMYTIDLR
jgi:hypothetical protein